LSTPSLESPRSSRQLAVHVTAPRVCNRTPQRASGGRSVVREPRSSQLTITAGALAVGSFYCLSKTNVEVKALPSPLVPLVVTVIVFPSFETAIRLVALYGPPVFFRESVNELASTC